MTAHHGAGRHTFMKPAMQALLDRIASWPDEDVAMLDAAARRIEALRRGNNANEEQEALDEAFTELEHDETIEARVRAAFALARNT